MTYAVCDEHRAVNGRHYLSFTVEGAADGPDGFELQPSPREYERLKAHSTGTDGVGRVPVVDDDGWAIDWDTLATEAGS